MVMRIIWLILAILGTIVGVWYFRSTIFNRWGRANYPLVLAGSVGHLISWFIIVLGLIAIVRLILILELLEHPIRTVLLILGTGLLVVSIWGWIGFLRDILRRIPFSITTLCLLLALTFISLGLILHKWLIAVNAGVGVLILYSYLMIRRSEEGRKGTWKLLSFLTRGLVEDPLYGMIKVMCQSYLSYMIAWKDKLGEESFKSVYGARYALHSRNLPWSVSRLNSFLANVTSFEELLLKICAESDEMPDRLEELRQRLKDQKEVNIPFATWTKKEVLESNVGSMENLGFKFQSRLREKGGR